MKTRTLGKTGIELPILSFGASSLGQEFRSVALDDALKSVQVALDCGLNFIDTSPFYGRGMSEVLLGIALRGVPRDSYKLCTKLGRYDLQHFDFSASSRATLRNSWPSDEAPKLRIGSSIPVLPRGRVFMGRKFRRCGSRR